MNVIGKEAQTIEDVYKEINGPSTPKKKRANSRSQKEDSSLIYGRGGVIFELGVTAAVKTVTAAVKTVTASATRSCYCRAAAVAAAAFSLVQAAAVVSSRRPRWRALSGLFLSP
ncbi:hypothetical protein V501_04935 [Pseudogymnoascus sp. VKM F-4519 (FW-2642)]|nr:hypothetical protein V501_04935 [Pseudogymnoascus sp. VKM F-4519 (FW-2642)]